MYFYFILTQVWTCGGSVKVVPCSHVGHVFREQTPHSYPGGMTAKMNTITRNIGRMSKVWMDDLYSFYLALNPAAKSADLGDLTERIELRSRLKCRSFRWFLNNVYPGAPLPTGHERYVGQIRADQSSLCLDGPTLRMCQGLGTIQVD